jgi:hypothetical protein
MDRTWLRKNHGHIQLLKNSKSKNEMDNIWPCDNPKNKKTNMAKYSMHRLKNEKQIWLYIVCIEPKKTSKIK